MTAWAIFGGSFDPPHIGHVLAATWVRSATEVDRVIVVPTLEHPFGKRMAPYPHRRRMAELAFAPLSQVEVSDIEARLGGASYTVRTLEALKRAHPDVTLRLIIGSDLVEQVPSWREGPRIPALAPLLVVGRAGHGAHQIAMPEVSSTEIRARLRAGEPVDGLVPRAVLEYLARTPLYAG